MEKMVSMICCCCDPAMAAACLALVVALAKWACEGRKKQARSVVDAPASSAGDIISPPPQQSPRSMER